MIDRLEVNPEENSNPTYFHTYEIFNFIWFVLGSTPGACSQNGQGPVLRFVNESYLHR